MKQLEPCFGGSAQPHEQARLMPRRGVLRLAAAGSLPSLAGWVRAQTSAEALLRAGGCVVMLRHAQTTPGVGDPPHFRLNQCSTQRNLSDAGRAQAGAIGRWFRSRALAPGSVWSSPWCRCKDTAAELGPFKVLAALGSTFDGRADATAQNAALRQRLASVPPLKFEVWVTHQVNITALTGEAAAMGEAVVLRAGATSASAEVLARMVFD